MPTLYYVHDPMCSWCYAFRPAWLALRETLPPTLELRRLLGGLAPDTDQPMPMAMREYLEGTWRRIQSVVPGTEFDFGFWRRCEPRRSTFRACRAVIAARRQDAQLDEPMTAAIQDAYYRQARNPADVDTLVSLAVGLGLDQERFRGELDAETTQLELQREIALSRELHADSFPSLVLVLDGEVHPVAVDYNRPRLMLDRLQSWLAAPVR